MIVKRASDNRSFTAIDGCEIVEVIGVATTDTREISLARAVIKPGLKTLKHYHNFTEIYMVISGKGIMHVNNESRQVQQGDNVLIPTKSWHCIENRSNKDLIIWCVCAPAFTPEATVLGS